MKKKKEQTSFLQRAIEGLSQEGFDEAVSIFQKYYLKNEIVNVNGTNDGGCDIKIYQNTREIKKCVQVTVRKDWENKLKKELENANNLITKYNYSDKYDFFCSSVISESKIEECKQYALNDYSIDLTIYEAHRLSQLPCVELKNHLYTLHDDIILKPNQLNLGKATKSLYDFLTVGKGSTDIKNDILNSFIVSILYEKGLMSITSLKTELESRLQKNIPDIIHVINLLKTAHRVESDSSNKEMIKLSESEYENAKNIFAYASLMEDEFNKGFQEIILKYNLSNGSEVLEKLKLLYQSYYKNDIDEEFNTSHHKTDDDIYKSFNTYLSSVIQDTNLKDSFVCEIKKLCENNTYLNRISASESFLSLYKSDRLEQYIGQKQKNLFVDTPVLVYLLCAIFQVDDSVDWRDSLYRSVKSLNNLKNQNSEILHFNVMFDYVGEVAGELKKAFQIAQLENAPCFSNLGNTKNTFYNYYRQLKDNELSDFYDQINNFEDFLDNLGIEETDLCNDNLLIGRLCQIIEDIEVNIAYCPLLDDFNSAKIAYEKQLYGKQKSDAAITHDVRQILFLLNTEDYENNVFITWDMSLSKLRDNLKDNNNQYKYFPIYNPAKLSNKIALELFNIDSSAITNDIYIYADKSFGLSSKVKSLLDIISPIFGNKEAKDSKMVKALGTIRKQQLDSIEYNEMESNKSNLPIESVFIKILDIIAVKEQEKQNSDVMKKFIAFMIDPKNEKYILEEIKKWSDAISKKANYNHDVFFENISKVEIKK
ncbi:MAG: hypothetical protein MJZ72_05760 [Bacteroidales bacterium]|nr:hypothetical protein [Bacteroidales bacterium]